MAERKYYTAPDVAERAIRGCWPELNFRLGEQIGHGGMSDVYKLAAGGRVEALKVTNSAARADTPELCEDLCWRGANELEYARRMSEAGCGVKVYDTAEFALSDVFNQVWLPDEGWRTLYIDVTADLRHDILTPPSRLHIAPPDAAIWQEQGYAPLPPNQIPRVFSFQKRKCCP